MTIIGVNLAWQVSQSDSTAAVGAAPANKIAAAKAHNSAVLLITILLLTTVTKMSRLDYPTPIYGPP
jgi:hypothetical protein